MRNVLGMKISDVASLALVSERTVQRYTERYRLTGGVSPFIKSNGPARLLSESDESIIVQTALDNPGVCLRELQQSLEATSGAQVDTSTICRTFQRLGFTYQKIKHLPQQRSDEARLEFMTELSAYDPSMFVWLDETGCTKRNAVREYGYALQGMTPRTFTFKSGGKRYTSIAAISIDGLEDAYITEGNVNGEEFLAYVRRSLLPSLMPFNGTNPKSVVIMDNASIHHIEEVVSTIEGVGALVKFLPPYSPDLNPVEEVFAQVKHWIRLNDTAFQATQNPRILIAMAFGEVTQENCMSYIKDSGYI